MYLNGLGGGIRMTFADNLLENIINSPNSTDELIKLARNRKNNAPEKGKTTLVEVKNA